MELNPTKFKLKIITRRVGHYLRLNVDKFCVVEGLMSTPSLHKTPAVHQLYADLSLRPAACRTPWFVAIGTISC